jgi:hypothetical protein
LRSEFQLVVNGSSHFSIVASELLGINDVSSGVDVLEWNGNLAQEIISGDIILFPNGNFDGWNTLGVESHRICPSWSFALVLSYRGQFLDSSAQSLYIWVHLAKGLGVGVQSSKLRSEGDDA